jgi:organic hydroperoxide reductase OsmC/OhrA
MSVRAKEFAYAIELDRDGALTAGGSAPVELDPEWTPEHLVLAGLVRCTLQSLRYHAARAGIEVAAQGSATGRVTKRDRDGRYAFVELKARLDVELTPEPPGDELEALLAKAERDCFVGASLTASPGYRWTVNGRAIG